MEEGYDTTIMQGVVVNMMLAAYILFGGIAFWFGYRFLMAVYGLEALARNVVRHLRAAEFGLKNVEFRVMDAERMDLDDDSVDGVLCRWGHMLMADPAAALRETRRVLRDKGRLVFSVWADPKQNLWASVPAGVLVERGHIPAPEPGAPGIFAMADPGRVRELVTGAGFAEPKIEPVTMAWSFDDFGGYWEFLVRLAGGLAMTINALPPEEQEAVRSDVRERLPAGQAGPGYRLAGVALNAVTS